MAPEKPGNGNVVLFMLLLAYIFNFLDRQIVSILAPAIKADLGLSDGQLGALGGFAFALLYTLLGIPLGVLADRTSKSGVIAAALAVWSGFTALCGVAGNFWQLFLFRVGVGFGEAGGVAPSYALIADYFPPAKRARALALYSLGAPFGLALGALLGALLAETFSWRMAFVVVGVAGILFAPVFRAVVRDPPRERDLRRTSPVHAAFSMLARKKSFWLISFGAAMNSMVSYALAFWMPTFLIRSFDMSLAAASYFYASLILIGVVAGILAGGFLADKLGQKDRGNYPKLAGIAWLASVPLFVAGFLSPSPALAWIAFLVPQGLTLVWFGPLLTAIQHLVPATMRATASACFLLVSNLFGLGAGSWIMGVLSDSMAAQYGDDSLRYAALLSVNLSLVASFLVLLSMRSLRKEWVD